MSSAESLVALIRQNDPARYVAKWLTDEANTKLLGQYVARAVEGALHMVEDRRIEQLLRDGVREVLAGVDLTKVEADLADAMRPFVRDDAVRLGGAAWFVTARNPA